ncbi:TMAO reductase system periplasmic protein TorT [Undibacterium crateris]|uniref:TMAO reductase system periplasmic protein TorT n=1 Tax=Undibacterium crateris TaxID=2528175 RepID=UPI001389D0B1|nr:TMAO reductase system periplasmic protein TorT [Undibacterium crateris]NDI87620.1 TMAO reductase system periplasmic protein TorT [Undibacterium crateris]
MKIFLFLLMLLSSKNIFAAEWFPVSAIIDGKVSKYVPLKHAQKAWRICALLPQTKDKYWWGVAWGLTQEALRQGVELGIYQAGGYNHLDVSQNQFLDCMALGVDAIVLAAISSDGLDSCISQAADSNIPVIDLINGVRSNRVTARSRADFSEMVMKAAIYLTRHSNSDFVQVAWFPGPKGTLWVSDAEVGVENILEKYSIKLIHAGYGLTEPNEQMGLVRSMLKNNLKPNYILGNAVAIEMSANYFRRYKNPELRNLISFYANEPVIKLIKDGRVLAAVSDSPVLQARISIDLAIRALEGKPYPKDVRPVVEIIDFNKIREYDFSKIFAPTVERFGLKYLAKKDENY